MCGRVSSCFDVRTCVQLWARTSSFYVTVSAHITSDLPGNIFYKGHQRFLDRPIDEVHVQVLWGEWASLKPASDYQLLRPSWPTGQLPTLPTISERFFSTRFCRVRRFRRLPTPSYLIQKMNRIKTAVDSLSAPTMRS